jgi:fumarylacetoacetase
MLPYLKDDDLSSYDLNLEVQLKTTKMQEWHTISRSNMKYLYFSVAQTIAHHTVTGCNLRTGDLLGSGTISAPEKSGFGSMLELCWGGKDSVVLPNGEERKFLQDGDAIKLTGYA